MKKNYLPAILFAVCIFTLQSMGQSAYDSLDINNIKANIYPANHLFWDGISAASGFEAPKGSGKSTVFTSRMWIGAVDVGGNLKVAAEQYNQFGYDFWSGPLDTTSCSIDPSRITDFNKVWKVSKVQIDSFINCFNAGLGCVNYTIPSSILTWPGNGDATENEGHFLAPFVDVNHDGQYDPLGAGDYPCIKGDQAVFYIFNDEGNIHTETQGAPLGIEVHAIAYAFNKPNDPALDNTMFINYQIIHRCFNIDSATWLGNWTDLQIGDGADDYVGCDVSRNAYYGYNADDSDAVYGLHPPAQGMVFLSGPRADVNDGIDNDRNGVTDEPDEKLAISHFMYYNNDFSATGNPQTAPDYYDYLKSIWIDGTHATYGQDGHQPGNPECHFMFPDTTDPLHPNDPWTEEIAGTTPGDRRALGAWGRFINLPGAVNCVDYAYVFSRDTTTDNFGNVATLKTRIDSVRSFYNSHDELHDCGCTPSAVGVNTINAVAHGIAIYPNPANDKLMIRKKGEQVITIEIYDVMGQTASTLTTLLSRGEGAEIDISALAAGIYFLKLNTKDGGVVKRFVKAN